MALFQGRELGERVCAQEAGRGKLGGGGAARFFGSTRARLTGRREGKEGQRPGLEPTAVNWTRKHESFQTNPRPTRKRNRRVV